MGAPRALLGTMAAEHVELVRSIYERWAQGDYSGIDWADPEIEFVIADGLDRGSWRGVDQMGAVWGDAISTWEDFRVIPEEYREVDDERVLVFLHNEGRAKKSGMTVEDISAKSANVVHVRDGKVTRLVLYWDRDRARADVGLS